MGFFSFVFGEIDVPAVIGFMVATLAVTSGLKFWLRRSARFCEALEVDFNKVILSWIVGAIVFVAMHFALPAFPVTQETIVQFAVWVLLLNGGYKFVTAVRDYIRDWKSKP